VREYQPLGSSLPLKLLVETLKEVVAMKPERSMEKSSRPPLSWFLAAHGGWGG
jgi:hypothetical protein